MYLQEVEKLAHTLNNEAADEKERRMARKVLEGLREKSLANLAGIIRQKSDRIFNGTIKKLKPGEKSGLNMEIEKEEEGLQVLNLALGLNENDRSELSWGLYQR